MKNLHWPRTLHPCRRLMGMAIAALLALSGAPSLVGSEEANAAPDAVMVAARAAAKGDGLLEALLTELDRSKAQLKMDQVQAPYYVEYRVNEVEDFGAEAAFGALRENQHIHVRVLRVVVRVGDYKQDSYFGRGQGESSILPLDDDPIALRHQIWLATDDAYKAAGQALAEKQAAMKQFSADPNPVDDFAKAPQMIAVEPTVSLKIDEAAWKKTLEDVTSLYKLYPDVQSVTASARFSGEVFGDQRVPGEFRRHGHAVRKDNVWRAIEQLDTSGRRDEGEPKPGVHGGATGRIADARRIDG